VAARAAVGCATAAGGAVGLAAAVGGAVGATVGAVDCAGAVGLAAGGVGCGVPGVHAIISTSSADRLDVNQYLVKDLPPSCPASIACQMQTGVAADSVVVAPSGASAWWTEGHGSASGASAPRSCQNCLML
jgi:hypothetical protein